MLSDVESILKKENKHPGARVESTAIGDLPVLCLIPTTACGVGIKSIDISTLRLH